MSSHPEPGIPSQVIISCYESQRLGHRYRQFPAYNLDLRSTIPVPGLGLAIPLEEAAPPLIEVWLQPKLDALNPVYSGMGLNAQGVPMLRCYRLDDGSRVLRYADETVFFINATADHVHIQWVPPYTLEDAATYLLGPVLGFVLRMRGRVCLHASGVVLGGRAVLFVGEAGAGKSTLAAAFASQGATVLTEDVASLEEERSALKVAPGYPLIRLWDASGKLLFGASESLPLLTPNWDKRYLDLTQPPYRFAAASTPLGAIFFLRRREPMTEALRLDSMGGQEVLKALLVNTYGGRLLEPAMRAREFEVLGRLARDIPIQALTLNSDGRRLPEICARIELAMNSL